MLRLPIYQRILAELVRGGSRTVSSEQLAELARVNAAKVRKDLSLLGSFGTRGSGYDPEFLIAQIDRALGVDENWSVGHGGHRQPGPCADQFGRLRVAWLPGHLALRRRPGRRGRGDPRHAGCATWTSSPACATGNVPDIGVITTPGWAAQGVADLLVRAGVTSFLNFAPRVLTVPPTVHLRYVDLSIELQVLGFYRARADEPGRTRPSGRRGRRTSSARSASRPARTGPDRPGA